MKRLTAGMDGWRSAAIGSATRPVDWQWPGLSALGKVERIREQTGKPPSTETAYYLCSIEPEAQLFAHSVRSHWGVENKVHWVLDMTFNEDACQVFRCVA
jgi:predicted transposase YbfD/YdcC